MVLAPRVEIDAFTQMKSLARLGVGATILSYAAVAEEVARGELRATPIVSPRVERRMYLAQTRGRPTSNAVRATIELLRTCVQEMHGEFWDVATAGE